MDITKVLADLRSERDRIERAILALEQLATTPRRRGRPPKCISDARAKTTEKGVESLKTA